MKRTSVVGTQVNRTRQMATPTRSRPRRRRRTDWRWPATVLTVVGMAFTVVAALKTVGYAVQLADPLTALSVIVLALVCLAAGVWALAGTWRQQP